MPMKLYGFWRSLATYRVRAALALKGIEVEQISINLLQGKQHAEDYKAINPQSVVPALLIDGGPPLFQSMAILEYLEETHPKPALLPKDPRGRARVRGLAQIAVSDGHPLVVPRIRGYLEREMHQDEPARNKWLAHWTLEALKALEGHLGKESETGRFCHGDAHFRRMHENRRFRPFPTAQTARREPDPLNGGSYNDIHPQAVH